MWAKLRERLGQFRLYVVITYDRDCSELASLRLRRRRLRRADGLWFSNESLDLIETPRIRVYADACDCHRYWLEFRILGSIEF
jgi:hypothetical protein